MTETSADPLFTQDIVMEFILSKEGAKISNPDLVNHFKNFLNDPIRKVANRQQFKLYINNLATVKLSPSGEKYLVLKKKFKDDINYANVGTKEKINSSVKVISSNAPLQNEVKTEGIEQVMTTTQGNGNKVQNVESIQVSETEKKEQNTNDESNPKSLENGIKISINPMIKTDDNSQKLDKIVSASEIEFKEVEKPDIISENSPKNAKHLKHQSKVKSVDNEFKISMIPMLGDLSQKSENDLNFNKNNNNDSEIKTKSETNFVELGEPIKALNMFSEYLTDPTLNTKMQKIDSDDQRTLQSIDSVQDGANLRVKDRALNINRSENEINKLNGAISSLAANNKIKRESRKVMAGVDSSNDSYMSSSLTAIDRDWILKAVSSDYQAMNKILQQHSYLAGKKDFITGYTALHWAAKNGQTDVIKLLCGKYLVNVNERTQGGYTALHLASQAGHEQIIELLVRVYGANPNIRDYSGYLAKSYLNSSASLRSHHMIMPQRPVSSINTTNPNNFNRLGSFRSLNEGKENTNPSSPKSLKPFRHEDYSSLMPPPNLPNIHRQKPKSKHSDKLASSDSESNTIDDPQILSISSSNPNLGSIV